ncbi:hypothetical protein J8I26_17340 [Herbaspirillum sp. LeCh32-8]|uniref:hypothetical protein n=1 Tax=Herbaspirillum sp. LeCh32-8 TaxID=2821356 RepID=UPI001AE89055|nr:hypothetical protein [Herbaspirillum sp. LeCh32-8]MBP0599879.1 hypothetical protein [Herbaspirillum sp. LeCh32-8]
MDDKTLQAFRACVAHTAPGRERVREPVAGGQWREAEPDTARARSYALRRRNLGAPQALASVNVNHWRVDIAAIEKITGLDFGAKVRGADTIKDGDQPQVGEARILVSSFAQIKL